MSVVFFLAFLVGKVFLVLWSGVSICWKTSELTQKKKFKLEHQMQTCFKISCPLKCMSQCCDLLSQTQSTFCQ